MVLMDEGRVQMDTTDKVKKLQDTIRKLQLQNEQLRAQQFAKNGLIGTQVCDSTTETDADPEIIPLNEIDLSDEQTWLYIPAKASVSDPKIDIVAWLRRKAEGNNNVVKEPSNLLAERLMPMDHGDKQSIDTRTFTRPKKRMGVLSSLTTSSMPENLKREEKRVGGHDELSAMLQSAGLPIKGVLDSILQKHRKNPVVAADTVISAEDKLMKNGATNDKLNSTFVFQEEDEQDIAVSPKKAVNVRQIQAPRRIGGLGSAGVKGSCPALDQTFEMPPPVKQASHLVRGRREMGSSPVLDSTFTFGKGSSPHSEEDCLSTTSDGSLSSSSRPMNVDDVQQIARLQEESLKQSTPVKTPKGHIGHHHVEEMPSPILGGNTVDDNHGYHSDRSSPVGSITDGVRGNRTFSQGSSLAGADSLHSSPMTSPHGSSQALHQIPSRNGWQHRDPQGHTMRANSRSHSRDNIHYNHCEETASVNPKEMKPVSEVSTEKLNANSDSCKMPLAMASQLRPQVDQGISMLRSGPGRGGIRPPGITSGIPRPQSRLQSRIPAPMQRIPVSRLVQKKPAKSDWMDGCY